MIEQACEFLPLIYHCSTRSINFRLQTSLISKKEKETTSCEKRLLGGILQKSFPKYFLKIYREIPVRWCLSNNVKNFQGVRLATLLKKDPLTGL